MLQILHEPTMPDNRSIPPRAVDRLAIPGELSCAEVIDRAVARFGWPALLHATAFVAMRDAKDDIVDAMNKLAEGRIQ